MLNKIKLTNFQRHRDLEVAFGPGISALRGSNEAGKSTLIRAICYALFGSKALANSLDETVTWGENTSTLKVELEIGIDNVTYSIKRGKSGAECNYDGGIVTGQVEVTNFIGKLLKADAASAARLMLANQNEIRGALEAGAGKTTELIEKLAEFDQIDNLVELMQENLTLGSTNTVEAAITAAEALLESAKSGITVPDYESLDAYVVYTTHDAATAEKAVAALDVSIEALAATARDIRAIQLKRHLASAAHGQATLRADACDVKLAEFRKVPAPAPGEPCDALRERLAALGDVEAVRSAYAAVQPFLDIQWKDDKFEGTKEALDKELDEALDQVRAIQQSIDETQRRIYEEQAKITTGACKSCGQDVSHIAGRAERNAEAAAALAVERNMATKYATRMVEAAEYVAALKAVKVASANPLRVLAQHSKYVHQVGNDLPPALEWSGSDFTTGDPAVEVAQIRKAIKAHEEAKSEWDSAQGSIRNLTTSLEQFRGDEREAAAALALCPAADVVPAEHAHQAEMALRPALVAANRAAQSEVHKANDDRARTVEAYQRAVATGVQAEETLASRRAELKELVFNNALLKAVRQARPIIADRLWNLVLAAVGKYFSEMRGEKSRVTKDGDGFKVNGHPATTLSGSTLDILGLAIRVALTRTFLPTAPFLVLDEPAAAMDEERTSLMLGFLVGAGFPQTLLVTHEDISEMVADNIITL